MQRYRIHTADRRVDGQSPEMACHLGVFPILDVLSVHFLDLLGPVWPPLCEEVRFVLGPLLVQELRILLQPRLLLHKLLVFPAEPGILVPLHPLGLTPVQILLVLVLAPLVIAIRLHVLLLLLVVLVTVRIDPLLLVELLLQPLSSLVVRLLVLGHRLRGCLWLAGADFGQHRLQENWCIVAILGLLLLRSVGGKRTHANDG
mmetsp:Transcript_861/g.2770  ORF Transcript_861/g.2770 Transcript_861/m.2770 type:complete len:202 (-) Transcript_861:99-704(-)